jgi:hypothetical protein
MKILDLRDHAEAVFCHQAGDLKILATIEGGIS